MMDLKSQVLQDHISENYPDARLVRYNSLESDLTFYDDDTLREAKGPWFPLSCHKDPKTGKLIVGGSGSIYHTYIEGETGVGKTTRFCMQSIRALSSMKHKPSFIVTDMHGEIIENLYCHLVQNGYSIKIVNCDDPERSDTYNPLSCIAEEVQEQGCITHDALQNVRNIAEIIQPIEAHTDPVWEQGARAYTAGCLFDKVEDIVAGKLSPQYLTIYNLIQTHYWLRAKLDDSYKADIFDIPHYKRKGKEALSVQKVLAVTNNAEKTRASYFGVVENHYDSFGQPSMYALSSNSTININEFIQKPTVIVIQSAATNIADDLISLLVNDIYRKVVAAAKKQPNKRAPRDIHCFLDEFANCNIADGKRFIKMLTTSRKFGMFWHLFLQCDAQLDRKFDPQISNIIRANCTEIFMGSNDYATRERFAKSCGFKTVESLASKISSQIMSTETVPLITAEQLNLTQPGDMFVKRRGYPLLKTYFEAFYNCEEFEACDDIDNVYPHNDFDYKTTCLYPDQYDSESEALKKNEDKHESMSFEDLFWATEKEDWNLDERLPPDEETTFDDEPEETDESEQVDEDHEIARAMEQHVQENRDSIDFSVFFKCTCIPLYLTKILNELAIGVDVLTYEVLEDESLVSLQTLKFSILQTYLSAHDYKNKSGWNRRIRTEYKQIKQANLFPWEIQECFYRVVQEITEELTYDNIQEIKNMISPDTDSDT